MCCKRQAMMQAYNADSLNVYFTDGGLNFLHTLNTQVHCVSIQAATADNHSVMHCCLNPVFLEATYSCVTMHAWKTCWICSGCDHHCQQRFDHSVHICWRRQSRRWHVFGQKHWGSMKMLNTLLDSHSNYNAVPVMKLLQISVFLGASPKQPWYYTRAAAA